MAENETAHLEKERAARVLISFPEPGMLEFLCESEDEAEDLYRAIRAALPDSFFFR